MLSLAVCQRSFKVTSINFFTLLRNLYMLALLHSIHNRLLATFGGTRSDRSSEVSDHLVCK